MTAIGLDGAIPIVSYVPMMMFAILFGLSMDYQVFLLSRIRERYSHTGDTRDAVVFGVSATASGCSFGRSMIGPILQITAESCSPDRYPVTAFFEFLRLKIWFSRARRVSSSCFDISSSTARFRS